jgi:hypothetical protein
MTQQDQLESLAERYLGLESFDVTEELVDLCGAGLNERALPILQRRLREEESQVSRLQASGYIRMGEKAEQLIASLKPLIAALEEAMHE